MCIRDRTTSHLTKPDFKHLVLYYYHFSQYLWVDEKGKKTRLSAPQYVDLLMTYVQKTINDETIFPTKHGKLDTNYW